MTIWSKRGKWMAGALAIAVAMTLVAMPVHAAKLPSAAYKPIQLEAVPTKEVAYYRNGSVSLPDTIEWVTDNKALTFLPLAAVEGVTSVVRDAGDVYWIGTDNGLQRVNFSEEDPGDIVQYMAGPRYLYGGDNHITGLASDGNGGIWARTDSGVTHITMPMRTMYDKTIVYEELDQTVNNRLNMIADTTFIFQENDLAKDYIDYHSPTGEFISVPKTHDNDGLWTSMYAIGEIYRYATLLEQYGANPTNEQEQEIEEAKEVALRATKAVLLLDYVSGRGNGFPARSYMLTDDSYAQTVDGSVYGYQGQNGFWFQHFVGEEHVNPNGIIPSMQRDDREPIGYSMVRVTKDSMTKKGSNIFASEGNGVMNYNGLGLSPDSIEELNKSRPDGQKLGMNIRTQVDTEDGTPVYQVLPVVTAATNDAPAFEDKSTGEGNKPLFQLTVPVYERIPAFFNDLVPLSALKDGHIDMNQVVYKADTSSDEVVGHYALFFTAYKYLVADSIDPELLELKGYIEEATKRMTDLILKNGHYYIEDATGKSTSWSKWYAKYFNDHMAVMEQQPEWQSKVGVSADKEDALSYGFEDGPLNALELMSALKTAGYVTESAYPSDAQRYKEAYAAVFEGGYSKEAPYVNGKGYIDLALEYIDRRLIRQATNAYAVNGNEVVAEESYTYTNDIGDNSNMNATIHGDWTQYINYSDEELAWFSIYPLLLLENDPDRHELITAAFDQWYENMGREHNPFYTFLYQLAHPERTDIDLESAVRYLYKMPQYPITFPANWNRQDVFYIEPGDRDKERKQTNYVLDFDERALMKNNGNPFAAYNQAGGANPNFNYNNGVFEGGTIFTLPYWMGRYFEMIKE
ncbi:hypothetical protein M6D81_08035 [Paenibacillus sp. J5C_2022]|nr:hypothetical protein [Paenibacillus sp. J5C2022]